MLILIYDYFNQLKLKKSTISLLFFKIKEMRLKILKKYKWSDGNIDDTMTEMITNETSMTNPFPPLFRLFKSKAYSSQCSKINPESLRNWTAKTYSRLATVKDMILRGYIQTAQRDAWRIHKEEAVGRNICTFQRRIIRPSTVYLLHVLLRALTSTVSHYYS